MTINELMQIAIDNYTDGLVGEYWTPAKGDRPGSIKWNREAGDTLALFIAIELKDTYNSDANDVAQCEEAARVLESAAGQLSDLASVFHEKAMASEEDRGET